MLLKNFVDETTKNSDRYLLLLYKNILKLKKLSQDEIINFENRDIEGMDEELYNRKVRLNARYKKILACCNELLEAWDKENIHNNMKFIDDQGYLINEEFDRIIESGLYKLKLLEQKETLGKKKFRHKKFAAVAVAFSVLGAAGGAKLDDLLKKQKMIDTGMTLITNEINEKGEVEYPVVLNTSEGPKIQFGKTTTVLLINGLEEYQDRYHKAGLTDEEGAIYLIDYGLDKSIVLSAFDTTNEKIDQVAMSKYYEYMADQYNNESEVTDTNKSKGLK